MPHSRGSPGAAHLDITYADIPAGARIRFRTSDPSLIEALPAADFNDADIAFAQMMVPHHAQAVEMAVLAAARASDPELRRLAAGIKAAQGPEIDTMVGWLTALGQPTTMVGGHDARGGMAGMMSEEDMAKLRAARGVDFDRMFARMMIAHHNGAIQMCQDIAVSGSHGDVKRLAATIQQTQAAEVTQLEGILDRL